MDAKHTPGPWKVGNVDNIFTSDLMRQICDCRMEAYKRADVAEENAANAALIAAAPDMLAALKDLVEQIESGKGDWRNTDTARAAITQAEGVDNG